MNKGEQFAIERIDPTATKSDSIDNVTIVWCAFNEKNKTVIVGWYENATVYRYFQESTVTPLFGIDRIYFTKAKAEDCYLLPEKDRTFVIERAAKEGKGRGFGQQNYWYAESSYAQTELIPAVTEFLETHKNERINRIYSDFDAPKSALIPLNESENEKADTLFYNGEYFDFLPYGYRTFYSTKSADAAFDIADALANLHQYNSALKWYKKAIDIDGENWSTTSYLPSIFIKF